MTRLTLSTTLTVVALLLCGSPSRIKAFSGDTPIKVGDGGSLLLRLDGLDAGGTWKFSKSEIRHRNRRGVLTDVSVTDTGSLGCAGISQCGVDSKRRWKIDVVYSSGSVTIESLSANKGVHVTSDLPFNEWKKTANADEREFGHGDGQHISSIKVNGGPNLCSGHGCVVTVTYRTP